MINSKRMNLFTRVSGALLVFLLGLSIGVNAQQSGSIKLGGPCLKCSAHILEVTKSIDGVQDASYDLATNLLSVKFDAGTSLLDISLELSIAGYDAGDFRRDTHAKLPPCCTASTRGDTFADADDSDLFNDVDADENWEDPDNLDALDRLSEHKAKSTLTDEDLKLLEDEDDDDDLLNIDGDDDDKADEDDDDE